MRVDEHEFEHQHQHKHEQEYSLVGLRNLRWRSNPSKHLLWMVELYDRI